MTFLRPASGVSKVSEKRIVVSLKEKSFPYCGQQIKVISFGIKLITLLPLWTHALWTVNPVVEIFKSGNLHPPISPCFFKNAFSHETTL